MTDYEDELPELTDEDRKELDATFCRPLVEVPLDAIFAELEMRFRSFIFYGAESQTDESSHTYRWSKGNYHERVGMIRTYQKMLEQ